jgi:Ca2+-binding EF-hand superfamily protein
MSSRPFPTAFAFLLIAVFGSGVFGQDDRRRGSWDPSEYLQRVDENKNGQMDPGELQGRLADYVRKLGFTTDQPIPISDIVKRSKGETSRDDKKNDGQTKREFVRKVPGFGVENSSTGGVVANFSADGSISNPAMLRRNYGDAIMSEVERSMSRYDADRDGVLNAEEIQRGRWGRPTPTDSDLNKDGRLTKYELAERYKLRQGDDRGGDRTSNTSRQRNDNGDRNDRGSRDERSSRDRDERSSRDRDERSSSSGSNDASDARAKARAAAEKAARERDAKRKESERAKEREESMGSSARERAREAARRELEKRKSERESGGRDSGSSSRGNSSSSQRDASDKYRNVANGMIRKYDKNGDGSLDQKEMESYRRPPENADGNGDGLITGEELLAAYVAKSGGSTSTTSSSRSSSRDEEERSSSRSSSRSRSSGSSSARDEDGDGRIKMSEFSDEWTKEKIDEFNKLDQNQDGYLSRDEFSRR